MCQLSSISNLAKVFITVGCALVLFIQSRACILKYFNTETTSNLAVRQTGKAVFPAFTICPDYDSSYKRDLLAQFGINPRKYQRGNYSQPLGEPLKPRDMYDAVTFKLSEMLKSVRLSTWDAEKGSLTVNVTSNTDLFKWRVKPTMLFGNCFSMEISPKASAYGLTDITFVAFMDIFIYLHHPGQVWNYDTKSKVYFYQFLSYSNKTLQLFIDVYIQAWYQLG